MLYITERSTKQTNLTNGVVLSMISLFVVAYDHEKEAMKEEGGVEKFLTEARSKGRLILVKPEGVEEKVELSFTNKGFLIKVSIETAAHIDDAKPIEELFNTPTKRAIPGFPNYELSNDGFIYNVKSGAALTKAPSYKLYKDGVATRMTLEDVKALIEG